MEEMKSKVYVLLDSEGRITRCEGGYTMSNIRHIEDWVLIDEGVGDKYNLCQSHYFPKPIMTIGGAYCYKLIDGEVVECTAEEIDTQEEANKPIPEATTEERIAELEQALAMLLSGVIE